MNAITAIGIENVKGFTKDLDIGKLTCIVGRNEMGKSALLYVPSLAIQGTAPQPLLGKGPTGVAKMSSGDSMVAAIVCEDGFSIRRDFVRNPKTGAITQKLTVTGVNGNGLTAAQQAIDDRLGAATWMFNLAEFATMTDSAKQAFILDICATGATDASHSVARLKLDVLGNLLPAGAVYTFVGTTYQKAGKDCTEEELADAYAKLATQLTPSLADALTNVTTPRLFGKASGALTAEAVIGILDAANQLKNEARKQMRESAATVRSLEMSRSQAGMGTERVEEIEKRQAAFNAQLNDVENKLGRIAAHTPALVNAKRRISAKTAAIQANAEAITAIEQNVATIPDMETEATDLRAKADQALAEAPEFTAIDAALLKEQKELSSAYERGKVRVEHLAEEIDKLANAADEMGECEEVAAPTVKVEDALQKQEELAAELAHDHVQCADIENELSRLDLQLGGVKASMEGLDNAPWLRIRRMLERLVEAIGDMDMCGDVVAEMEKFIEEQCGEATQENVDKLEERSVAIESERQKLLAAHKKVSHTIEDKGEQLAEIQATIAEQAAKVAAWEKWQRYQRLYTALETATQAHAKETDAVETCRKQLAALSVKIEEQEALVEEGRKLQKDKTALANKWQAEAAELDRTIKGLRKDYEQAKTDATRLKEELAEAETEAKRIEKELAALGPAETLEDQKQATLVEIAKLSDAMEKRREYETISKNYETELSNATTSAAIEEVAKAAEEAAKSMRSSIIADQAKPLLEKVNTFLATAYPGHTAYCDLVNPKGAIACELGVVSEAGVRVPWESFSGWQNAMFGAALVYAFSTMKEHPLRVLTVEMDGVDAANRFAMMKALAAVGTDLSNVLVATCWPFSEEQSAALTETGWAIVNIEEKAT